MEQRQPAVEQEEEVRYYALPPDPADAVPWLADWADPLLRASALYSAPHWARARASLAAADAFGGDTALEAIAVQRVDQMQHNAIAAGGHRMAEADAAAVDIQASVVNASQRPFQTKYAAAEIGIVPGGLAGQHLGGEGFIKLPEVDVLHAVMMAFE